MYNNNIKTKMKPSHHLCVLMFSVLLTVCVVEAYETKYELPGCYNKTRLKVIPPDHIYHKLLGDDKKPIVVGDMGNIRKHQENTLEGMKSLIAIKGEHFSFFHGWIPYLGNLWTFLGFTFRYGVLYLYLRPARRAVWRTIGSYFIKLS